jgi:hypothetical protein
MKRNMQEHENWELFNTESKDSKKKYYNF